MHKFFLAFILLSFNCFSQVDNARKTVEKLCSPEFHGRGYVNGGDSIAAAYLVQQYKEIGCKFYKKNPYQPFRFTVNTFPSTVSLTVDNQSIHPGDGFVVAPNCGTYHGTISCSEIGINQILSQDSLKYFISSLKAKGGKSGLVFKTYLAKGDTLKRMRSVLDSLNKKYLVVEVVDDKFTWSVEGEQANMPLLQVQKSALEMWPETVSVKLDVDAVLRTHTARNVIAYIPAKKKTKKTFVFSAHYDHLGQMGDSAYFPGGNDNASGTAMLLELARYFKKHRGNVNVVFMSFAGEEAGLYGSRYYVSHPLFPLTDIQFLFNLDIMGSGEDGVTIVNGSVFQKEFDLLTDINKTKNLLTQVKIRGKAANSDHYFFSEAGVPAFFMYTMGPNKHYHDVGDTYQNLSFNEFNDIYQLLIDFEELTMKK